MAASCRHCGGEDGRYNDRGNHFHCVKICEDCGDFCCDKCAPCQRCPQCNGSRISLNEWRNRKRSNSSAAPLEPSKPFYLTDTTGQGFVLYSAIAAIWLLPFIIGIWVFIVVWYWVYRIFGLDWRPFTDGFWIGVARIFMSIIGGGVVGGICSLFLGPLGVLIGIAIFLSLLNCGEVDDHEEEKIAAIKEMFKTSEEKKDDVL